MPKAGTVLDTGGRIQPYRTLLPETRYLAIDLRVTPLVNVVAKAERIPFPSQGFDLFCALKCWSMPLTRALCFLRFTAF